MGFFSTSPPAPTLAQPQISSDGTPIAPNRSQRSQCWEHRDAYFACLDTNNIIDSIKDSATADAACGPQNKAFEQNCASSWVTYFKKRRVMEAQKEATLSKLRAEGAHKIPGELPPQRKG